MLIAGSREELIEKLNKWKEGMETKGLRINMMKTKRMVSDCDTGSVRSSSRWQFSVRKGVGSNCILCFSVYIGCIRGESACRAGCSLFLSISAEIVHVRLDKLRIPAESAVVSNESLEVVNKFCNLGDMISSVGGVEKSIVARIRRRWKKFRQLLPPKAKWWCTVDVYCDTEG